MMPWKKEKSFDEAAFEFVMIFRSFPPQHEQECAFADGVKALISNAYLTFLLKFPLSHARQKHWFFPPLPSR
jgi:hypothetical protein